MGPTEKDANEEREKTIFLLKADWKTKPSSVFFECSCEIICGHIWIEVFMEKILDIPYSDSNFDKIAPYFAEVSFFLGFGM